MIKINYSTNVSYSVEQMYSLINDINKYSKFLPNCTESCILNQNKKNIVARIKIFNMGIKKTFITHNTLKKNKNIKMKLICGPFRHLIGSWNFIPIKINSCNVRLKIDLDFFSFLENIFFDSILRKKINIIVQSFIKRAQKIYNE